MVDAVGRYSLERVCRTSLFFLKAIAGVGRDADCEMV